MVRRMKLNAIVLALLAAPAASQVVSPLQVTPDHVKALPMHVVGRVEAQADGSLLRQWPDTYFETAFDGPALLFRVASGDVSLRVSVDDRAPIALLKPAPGYYRISDIGSRRPVVRMQVASENQDGPTGFGGFFAPAEVKAAPLPQRTRQIEFIGDSHTVGYGNTSPKRQCTKDEIWSTTDTTLGVPGLVGAHYRADYQVNAISGRGIVRNYNGFAADSLPQAYPYVLFDRSKAYADPTWRPSLYVISLGTNDFSTPLNAGEQWSNRAALQSDYEATFLRFLAQLHQRDPSARMLLWAANPSSELSSEIRKVAAAYSSSSGQRTEYVPIAGLAMTGCDYHPSVADDQIIAAALEQAIDRYDKRGAGERG